MEERRNGRLLTAAGMETPVIHLIKTVHFTGNPSYSIPSYSC